MGHCPNMSKSAGLNMGKINKIYSTFAPSCRNCVTQNYVRSFGVFYFETR